MKKSFLEKIQKLPLRIRKIILLAVVISLGISLTWVWSKSFAKKLGGFREGGFMEGFKIPSLKERLEKDLPKMEAPKNILKPEFPRPEIKY